MDEVTEMRLGLEGQAEGAGRIRAQNVNMGGGVGSVIEHLLSLCEVLGSVTYVRSHTF